MSDLFSGLENLGIRLDNDVDLYEKSPNETESEEKKSEYEEKIDEAELLFDKSFTCPVCDAEFKTKMVRTGKARLMSTDNDFRPIYKGIDPIKYDAILCPKCGYASLNRYFNFVMGYQAKQIKEKISKTYRHRVFRGDTYTYDEAILRYKMALLNTVVKNGKISEKAYTCLKLAWLFRGKREEMAGKGELTREEAAELAKEEINFLKNALSGFVSAFSREQFPMCGMDSHVVMLLVGELALELGEINIALQWTSKLMVEKNVSKRIKDKAQDLNDRIKEKRNKE